MSYSDMHYPLLDSIWYLLWIILNVRLFMSNGYLLASKVSADEMQKNRYMKFEKATVKNNLHVYTRMEYASHEHKLVDRVAGNSFFLSKYGVDFFKAIENKGIYFSYFLLTNNFHLEDAISNALQEVASNAKISSIFLLSNKQFEIEENKTYRICFEPPVHKHIKWR